MGKLIFSPYLKDLDLRKEDGKTIENYVEKVG